MPKDADEPRSARISLDGREGEGETDTNRYGERQGHREISRYGDRQGERKKEEVRLVDR